MCQVDSDAEPRHVYWLFGKERTEFSVEDCDAKGRREVLWTGVRGSEDVRNLKNVRNGDVLYLCESGRSPAITGILEAVGDPVPDATAWDAEFSKKHWVTKPDRVMPGCSIGSNPYWAVQVKLVKAFPTAVPLAELAQRSCWTMLDVHNGQVTQLSENQWDAVIEHSSA
ncbi:probable thymocyte nuclear protein 1 [Coccomyxa sp. Obi]|nr:probable thymocyte nuclear protein 1 [Coccomyxa sp. Obi]